MKNIPWPAIAVFVTLILAVLTWLGKRFAGRPRIRGIRNAPSWLVGRSMQFLFLGPDVAAIENAPEMYRKENKRWKQMPNGGTYAIIDRAKLGHGAATTIRSGTEYQIGFQFDNNPSGKYRLMIRTDRGTIILKFDPQEIPRQ